MKVNEFLAEVDRIVASSLEQSGFNPCCSRGCSTCCSEPVYADLAEVQWMLQGMTKEQIETLKERAAQWLKQALPFLSVPLVSSFRYLKADIKCPFLKGNLCSVYERRPMSCRTHFAIGNPEHCKLPHRPNQLILQFQFTAGGWPALWIKWFTSHITQLDHIGLHLHNLLFGTEIKSSQYQIWPPS